MKIRKVISRTDVFYQKNFYRQGPCKEIYHDTQVSCYFINGSYFGLYKEYKNKIINFIETNTDDRSNGVQISFNNRK